MTPRCPRCVQHETVNPSDQPNKRPRLNFGDEANIRERRNCVVLSAGKREAKSHEFKKKYPNLRIEGRVVRIQSDQLLENGRSPAAREFNRGCTSEEYRSSKCPWRCFWTHGRISFPIGLRVAGA